MKTRCFTTLAAGLLVMAAFAASARADDAAPAAPPPDPCRSSGSICDPPPDGCCPDLCLPDALFRVPCLDDCYDQWTKAKGESCFRLGAGAYHWVHVDNQGDNEVTYGYPGGGEGTYFYYFTADLECPNCGPCSPKFGAHAQARARDDTVFRSFFEEKFWLYEGYAYMDHPRWGKFEVGKIWKRFGLDWDGTFWGNVPYYDGMKLDPDWGVAWQKSFNKDGRLSVDACAQFFLEEDGVNGSIQGGDAESSADYEEETTFVARAVPTWHFTKQSSLALGVSALFGNESGQGGVADESLTQFAADLTFTWCGLKVFGEYATSDGIQNLSHYATGGPSDTYRDHLVGAEYRLGAFTPRVVYSHGDYENPGGKQDLLLVGGTVALTKWLTLYLEYVKWTVDPDSGPESTFEDGFQIVLNWNV